MPPHASVAFCNSDCTFSSCLSLFPSLSLSAMPVGYINVSYTRNNKCLRFRLTLLSLSFFMRPWNHSHYFAALMSRSYVQLPRRQKLSARYSVMRIFFLQTRDHRDAPRLWKYSWIEMMNITRRRKCECIIKSILQYSRFIFAKMCFEISKAQSENKTDWFCFIFIR